jgi:hypothetical protein
VFFAPQPDLSMLKMVCDLGVTALALGVPAWGLRAGRPALRRAGVVLLTAGVVLTATAGGLDATARSDGHGIIVPAFHDAAADHAVPYAPVCRRAALPVCVHPAYDGGQEPAALAAIIGKIVGPVAGVPGMPVRAEQSPATRTSAGGVQGNPPVLAFQPFIMHGSSLQPPAFETFFEDFVALSLFVAPGSPIQHATPAQRACALYLLRQAGDTASPSVIPPAAAVSAAADRLAALRPAARDAWLTAHLAALRAGSLTTEDIP